MRTLLSMAAILALAAVAFGITVGMQSYYFHAGCEGHLKRAADANTAEMALDEMNQAIEYAEAHGLTTGTTAIILPTPSEDIGFWYKNLVASRDELRKLGPDAAQLTRTNVLMKLRQTLLDKTQSGESVTAPGSISLHPHEKLYAAWGLISILGLFVVAGLIFRAKWREDFTPAYPKVPNPLSGFPRSRR